jgi:uncharacterized membrane protein (DUF485 family)
MRNKMSKQNVFTVKLAILSLALGYSSYRLGMVAEYGNPNLMSTALSGMFSVVIGIFAGISTIAFIAEFLFGEDS